MINIPIGIFYIYYLYICTWNSVLIIDLSFYGVRYGKQKRIIQDDFFIKKKGHKHFLNLKCNSNITIL